MKQIVVVVAFVLVSSLAFSVRADNVSDKVNQIAELEKKVSQLQSQAKTLSGQIAVYDSQIKLNSLKIEQTEDQIASFSSKIALLESSLQDRSRLLEKQIVQTYKKGGFDELQLLFSSSGVSDLISRFKYLQIVQETNRKFLHDTQVVQSNYADQKSLIEQSQKKLETQKTALASVRRERENLLKQTKNDESTYQKQLEQARLELLAIQNALASSVQEGPVKKGDPIAVMGNSGYPSCSSGKHLHFEVRQGDSWVNAESYLKSMTDKWGLTLGSGSWDWPVGGNIEITQRYGHTPWSYRYAYSGGIHTGIDMVSNEEVIKAVADGTLYSSVQKCGSSILKLKYIDHGSGLKTFYLHIQ